MPLPSRSFTGRRAWNRKTSLFCRSIAPRQPQPSGGNCSKICHRPEKVTSFVLGCSRIGRERLNHRMGLDVPEGRESGPRITRDELSQHGGSAIHLARVRRPDGRARN
jgi:hypothetical protein